MPQAPNIDCDLITWGDRLFHPGNRVGEVKPQPKLGASAASSRAAAIRQRIEATVIRRALQVMVKATGGGRDIRAIAARFRYISKSVIFVDRFSPSPSCFMLRPRLPVMASDHPSIGPVLQTLPECGGVHPIALGQQ